MGLLFYCLNLKWRCVLSDTVVHETGAGSGHSPDFPAPHLRTSHNARTRPLGAQTGALFMRYARRGTWLHKGSHALQCHSRQAHASMSDLKAVKDSWPAGHFFYCDDLLSLTEAYQTISAAKPNAKIIARTTTLFEPQGGEFGLLCDDLQSGAGKSRQGLDPASV